MRTKKYFLKSKIPLVCLLTIPVIFIYMCIKWVGVAHISFPSKSIHACPLQIQNLHPPTSFTTLEFLWVCPTSFFSSISAYIMNISSCKPACMMARVLPSLDISSLWFLIWATRKLFDKGVHHLPQKLSSHISSQLNSSNMINLSFKCSSQ